MEMLPQLEEFKIQEALISVDFNIESAVSHLVFNPCHNTPHWVYAALPCCNKKDDADLKKEER